MTQEQAGSEFSHQERPNSKRDEISLQKINFKGENTGQDIYRFKQYQRPKNKLPIMIGQGLRMRRQRRQEKQKPLKGVVMCDICYGYQIINPNTDYWECGHDTKICWECLNSYVAYKAKMFQQIVCPIEDCQRLINKQSQLYIKLPQQILESLTKVTKFYQTSRDPSKKLCPRSQCNGVVNISYGKPLICQKCKFQFCGECWLQKHDDTCENFFVQFSQKNLKYRQCRKCKSMIQKVDGCEHMTCTCKHQFCYICGKDWSSSHKCDAQTQKQRQLNLNNQGEFQNSVQMRRNFNRNQLARLEMVSHQAPSSQTTFQQIIPPTSLNSITPPIPTQPAQPSPPPSVKPKAPTAPSEAKANSCSCSIGKILKYPTVMLLCTIILLCFVGLLSIYIVISMLQIIFYNPILYIKSQTNSLLEKIILSIVYPFTIVRSTIWACKNDSFSSTLQKITSTPLDITKSCIRNIGQW